MPTAHDYVLGREVSHSVSTWLMDLARTVPGTIQLDGYDISDKQFPPRQLWPANVSLGLLNSLQDPPSSLTGQYDVVHLRMWASNLRAGDFGLLLGSVKKMLKPGGYIQWEDADLVHQHVQTDEARDFEKSMNALFMKSGVDYSWVHALPATLRRENVVVLHADQEAFSTSAVHLCTKLYLLALEEIIEGITATLSEDEGQEGLRMAHECRKTLKQLISRCNLGLVYNWGPVSIVAKVFGG
ncbi:hypothetical protein G6O67_000475 [Ophiocordyceps sinensis]|uniref:UMTA methyltransferase family protein n=1 Tax=Ophiocordyceps sinensis TaxID=72228 RepID=A0A8H4PZA8_9HYPO|nr:hypothetical protein G6O67_000475 [Ophiocordyceps sinensis]